MDDIGQIVNETIRVSIPEFIRLAFAGMAGGLIGAYINDRLTRKRDMESGIMAEKKIFIPLIDGLIEWAKKGNMIGHIRYESEQRLFQPAMRFRLLLKDRRLILFNEAWTTLIKTTQEEVCNQQYSDSDEAKKMQQTILSRLEAVRKVVHET